MLATSEHFHYLKTCLLLSIIFMIPPIVQPLSFNITNFSDPESASIIQYTGVAKIENGAIVFKPLINNGVGRAIYGQPLRLKNASKGNVTDFSTRFSFTIDARNKTNYGDGLAFYMAPLAFDYQTPPNSSDGFRLGLYGGSQDNIVAVKFDTCVNEYDPPMLQVGINRINNNSVASLVYKKFDIQSNIGKMGHALITYNASVKLLAVSWFFEGTSSGFTPNDTLSHQIDLMEILPNWVTVGFSGATGSSKEENVIHSWEFSANLDLNSTDQEANNENFIIITKYKVQVKVVVVAVICSNIVVLVVISIFTWLIIKTRRTEDGFDLDKLASMPRRFGYKELVAATNGFADDRRLGEGGYAQVYKGFLSDLGRVVAVKRIFSDVEDSEEIFRNEVKIISRLIHRNLVEFIGWCHERGESLLVFEYMTNGSLDTHIFGDNSGRTLTWGVRYKIALGVARALRYLHEDAEQCVLHRDIKSANVLLDTDFNTKISDFGIAKLVDPRLRTQKTRVVGTYGYLAPEYMNQGRVSKESDMYGFGVVVLEMACGRKTSNQDVPLVNWVWKHYVEGNIVNVADKDLRMDFDAVEMTCLLTVGLWCTLHDHKKRPKAEQVINVLEQQVPLPNIDNVC